MSIIVVPNNAMYTGSRTHGYSLLSTFHKANEFKIRQLLSKVNITFSKSSLNQVTNMQH